MDNENKSAEVNMEYGEINPYAVENDPELLKKPEFHASTVEKIFSVLMYVTAYIYIARTGSMDFGWYAGLGVFTLLFIVAGEIAFRNKKQTRESICYLCITVLTMTAILVYDGLFPEKGTHVWAEEHRIFMLHLFAVYWILIRSGKLAEKKTSRFFLWDGIVGFFVLPFKNFILQILCFFDIFKGGKLSRNLGKILAAVLSAAAGLILLWIALSALSYADDNFAFYLNKVIRYFKFEITFETVIYLWFAIPVSLYLFGLIFGSAREKDEVTEKRYLFIQNLLTAVKKVPSACWIVIISVFSVFYIAFFILQGSYMFDAFRLTLPEGFIYSSYARRGFSEMCVVMVVNFVLYFLAVRTAQTENRSIKAAVTVLNLESILFAVIAFLKIYMYMNAYGFTPLRVQSLWLVCVLFLGCVLTSLSMYLRKDLAAWWFHISAGSLFVLLMI